MSRTRSTGVAPELTTRPLENGYWNAAIPSVCVVPLQQHTGSSLNPAVSVGDTVREGTLIADSDSRLGLPIHAPIPGRIVRIGRTILADGTHTRSVAIELDGAFDQLGHEVAAREWREAPPAELLARIRDGGVVCSPRSPTPAHLVLSGRWGRTPPYVVLDVAETEPFLSADAQVAIHETAKVIEGLQIAAAAVGIALSGTSSSAPGSAGGDRLHAVVSRTYRAAASALRRAAGSGIRVHTVGSNYPANMEPMLRRSVAGARADSSIPVIPISPSTAAAIYDAVVLGKPQIDRVVAVGGGAVRRPAHVRVRVGTSVADVLHECGGLLEPPARMVLGGALTGYGIENVNLPVLKGTAAVLALSAAEVNEQPEAPCIGCGACIRACPVSINPMLLHNLIADGREDTAVAAGIMDCTECGLCAHVCPSRIPLTERIGAVRRAERDQPA